MMQMMYETIYKALEEVGLENTYVQKVYLNFFCLENREAPDGTELSFEGSPAASNSPHVFLGQSGGLDTDRNQLPRLVYVSREKRPGHNHHKKAGAMNALVRVSAMLTNVPYLLNLDCDHYINNGKALREGMYFMMDPLLGKKINMNGLDGIQGPIDVGMGCIFRRQYGFDAPKTKNHIC
ncbi:hypothetical protein GIB67_040620 [Kingdonia uniflora]|uniref:Cellulose synthase n=1 Tax=Kingdonia uniflora TaxID=39325 RepID=A0A7J7M8Y0_9MAGN|nr:hypothetical protein GIB67_040620 [Kingdonia uniflora]